MVLRVRLNTEDKGDLFVERTPDSDFLVKVGDLRALGFRDPAGTIVSVSGEPYVSLKSMRGVSFEFREQSLALDITADPTLLPSRTFAMEGQRPKGRGAISPSNSGFFNYALNVDRGSGGGDVGLSAEAGWRFGDYLLLSNGATAHGADGARKFVRLMSSVTRDDRRDLQRIVIGDFFTPSRDFSAGVNLGGISLSKLYSLNPYFVQFPTQSVGGTAALPSDLEVYLDGQRIRTEKLQPGQFQLNDILAYQGASNVQLVLRDAFGRVQQLNYSFYFSDQLLRHGLHEYSYNVGAMRRNYGLDSNEYGPAAFSMFHRYGFTDSLTLGLRADATRGFANAGPLATLVLGDAGVLSMALAGSSVAGHHGTSGFASYSYRAKTWSAGAALRRDSGEYATLGDPPAIGNRKAEGNLSVSYYLPRRGSISLTHSLVSTRGTMGSAVANPDHRFVFAPFDASNVTALSYGVPLFSGKATLSASLSHVRDSVSPQGRNEAYVALIVFLDKDYSVSGSYRGTRTSNSEAVQFTKNQPIGEGLGFLLSADRSSDGSGQSLQDRSTLQYNAPAAIFRADVGHVRASSGATTDDARVSVAGGVGFVGGSMGFGRPITDSFGIVKVGPLPGVDVSVNGLPIGKTDARGEIFVPTLTPYFDNAVAIETKNIPLDYVIPAPVKMVSPSLRSGAMVEFGVTKLHAFTGKLAYAEAAGVTPVKFSEVALNVAGKKQTLETGRGGEFYVENLSPGAYEASVEVEGRRCLFDLNIPKSDETFVDLGTLTCRVAP